VARSEYTIPISGQTDWDRATIYQDEGGWYYCPRRADPHGEEMADESVGPFASAGEAERRAREWFIAPPPDPDTE
jgi:hypothetical protein